MKYDRAGDITFGANFEYRFNMVGPVEGALFVDAGNIWNLREQEEFKGGKFSKDFYKEIAVGTGLGFRLDLSVFVFRLDFAVKAWDPSRDLKERFVLDEVGFSDISVQFGIGYPF